MGLLGREGGEGAAAECTMKGLRCPASSSAAEEGLGALGWGKGWEEKLSSLLRRKGGMGAMGLVPDRV